MTDWINRFIRNAKRFQNDSEIHPKWSQNAPSWTNWTQAVRSWLEVGPLLTLKCRTGAQDGFTMPKVGPQIASGWPKLALRSPHEGPSRHQDGSMCAQVGPKKDEVGPKTAQSRVNMPPSGHKLAPRLHECWQIKNIEKPNETQ